MANCPVCGQNIQEDFGLVNCSSCGSPVLLGMDGDAQEVAAHPEPEPESESEPEPESFLEEEQDLSDMSDVAAFGNSDESSGLEGNLKFNLKITGIDSLDVKTGLKEVLLDSKLHLDPEQTIAQVNSGELFLEGLSAVKCAILVQRLKPLSLEINWEQYAIQQA